MKLAKFDLYHKDTYYNKNLGIETFAIEKILVNVEQISSCRLIMLKDKNALVEIKLSGSPEYFFGKFQENFLDLDAVYKFLASDIKNIVVEPAVVNSTISNNVQHPPLIRKEKNK